MTTSTETFPLSYAQQRLWFLQRMEGPNAVFNLPIALRITGALNTSALLTAIRDVVARHESLRTVLRDSEDETPYQHIFAPETHGLRIATADITEEQLPALCAEFASTPVDITKELPFRAWLYRLDDEHHVLFLLLHHIAGDGWSLGVLKRDLGEAYTARRSGHAPGFRELEIQYADYTLWQKEMLGDENQPTSILARQLEFWRRALSGMPEELALPADRPRPTSASFRGGLATLKLNANLHRALAAFAQETGASLFMVLQAALAALLSRHGAGEDIPLGTPVAGRDEEALEELIGIFVNTLVLRTDVSGDPSFRELVARVRDFNFEAFVNRDVPFDMVVHALQPERSLARQPLFQVMLALQNSPGVETWLDGLEVKSEPLPWHAAKFDLTLSLEEKSGPAKEPAGIEGFFEYSSDLFDHDTVEMLGSRLIRLLTDAMERPSVPLSKLEFLAPLERKELLHSSEPRPSSRSQRTVPELFALQVTRDPHAIALVFGEESISYGELDTRSNRVANGLIETGVGPDDLVGICMERSLNLIVAALGTLKAGAAYLPLDPEYPQERLEYMISDARPVMVLRDETLAQFSAQAQDHPPVRPVRPANAAYVIYTSGSTGKPKGVVVSHRNVSRLLEFTAPWFEFGPTDVWTLFHSFSFDFSVWEIWGPLLTGGRLVVVPRVITRAPEEFLKLLTQHRVTVLNQTPSAFYQLLPLENQAFTPRVVIFGGEALEPRRLEPWYRTHGETSRLINMYGITETTVHVTYHALSPQNTQMAGSPIGESIPDLRVYVLDAALKPVPPGVAGELYVAGDGLARGYLNQPALTSTRFVANPYGEAPGDRMYRSGDLARWRKDGTLEYLGRGDTQVKIRGFRIELGEIEAALLECPGVRQGAVIVRGTHDGSSQLVAYFAADASSMENLKSRLSARLPDYMVPSAFVAMDALPLTINGKLDRAALPEPVFRSGGFRTPRTPEEEILCNLYADVLGLERVGLDDDFFALGGHSLLAARLVSRVRTSLGADITIRTLFEAPSVIDLAARLKKNAGMADLPLVRQQRPQRLPLSHAQRRLWFLERLEQDRAIYNLPITFRMEGPVDPVALEATLNDVIARHESLRTKLPDAEGEPYQQILPAEQAHLPLRVEAITEAEVIDRLLSAALTGFDLTHEMPVRSWLYRLGENQHVWLILLHHSAGDGWSLQPLLRDLSFAYQARLRQIRPSFRELPVQYADYTLWRQKMLGDEDNPEGEAAKQLRFWKQALTGIPTELNLPLNRARPARPSFRGDLVSVRLDAQLHRDLLHLARATNASLFMIIQAGFAALLSRLGAGEDIPVGTAVAGRGEAATEDLIGFFVNTLVLRTDLSGRPSFRELISRVREFDLEAYANQDLPFERVVEVLQPERSLARQPLFQVMLALQNTPDADLHLDGVAVRPEPLPWDIARFDLMLSLHERYGSHRDPLGMEGVFEYSVDLFDRKTIESAGERFIRLLRAAVASPDAGLHELEILTVEERQHLIEGFQVTEPADLLSPKPELQLQELFEAQAARTPHAIALVSGAEMITYADLNARANRLAHRLIACIQSVSGQQPLVAIQIERSIEMVVAALAVLKAGGAYLPLDPEYPAARIAYMLEDAKPTLVLDAPTLRELESIVDGTPEHSPSIFLDGSSGAYVIYTSGSSGKPKGVVVTHENVSRLFSSTRPWFHFGTEDVWTLFHSFSFDFSVWEMWGPLTTGGRLVIVPRWMARSPEDFLTLLQRENVTVLNQTPSAFYQFLLGPSDGLSLKFVIFGGEALDPRRLAPWFEQHGDGKPTLINMYGITETTVHVTYQPLSRDTSCETASIVGRSIPDLRVYVLDDALEPVPVGVPGEMYVAGAGLARGYLNRPGLTAARFIANPYSPISGARMYRSGDRARWRTDGILEYLGRADEQVKVRGFRIEPGEIEAALMTCEGIAQAAVITRADVAGEKQLAAYIVPDHSLSALTRVLHLEQSGELKPDDCYELPSGLAIKCRNHSEADFLYREIFEDQAYLKHGITLPEAGCVFDVGANIGLFTVFVSQYAPATKIYAFEPIPPLFDALRTNAAIHSTTTPTVFNCGLSSQSGTAEFVWYKHNSVMSGRFADSRDDQQTLATYLRNETAHLEMSGAAIEELVKDRLESEQFTCELRTISEIITKEQIETIDLLKVDVEKSELDVLQGISAEDWHKIQQVVVEVHDMEGRMEHIVETLTMAGFTLHVEQDEVLRGTAIYSIYGRRPEYTALAAPQRILSSQGPQQLIERTRQHLQRVLPDYMTPGSFTLLPALPLTTNGKLDRRALPEPERRTATYRPPSTEAETAICEIYAEVLNLPRISVDDNFFALGGHSLQATRVVSRVRRRLGVEFPIRWLFETPIAADLAARIPQAVESSGVLREQERPERLPLSYSQQRLWFLHQMDPASTEYNMPDALRLRGHLDREALQRAVRAIVARHEMLRTSFIEEDESPVQRIELECKVDVEFRDLTGTDESQITAQIRHEWETPFHLERAPLLRAKLLKLGEDEHIFLRTFHHIASDGWSIGVFNREFRLLYEAFSQGRENPLSPLKVQYADFALWQRKREDTGIAYWKRQLAGVTGRLDLPTDRPRPAVQTFSAKVVQDRIPPDRTRALARLGEDHQASLYMTLLTAFGVLLERYTGQDDIVIGSPVANRQDVHVEDLIGFFVNALVLRVRVNRGEGFGELLHQVRDTTLEAYEHQNTPFERIVEELGVERRLDASPLFQVMFALQNAPMGETQLSGLEIVPVESAELRVRFDLELHAIERDGGVDLYWLYNSDLFDPWRIERMAAHFRTLVDSIPQVGNRASGYLSILDEGERQSIEKFNPAGIGPQRPFMPAMFECQAAHYGDAPALQFANEVLSYAQLNARANRWAHSLIARGIGPGKLVAVALERSTDLIAVLLGILKTGAAYLPLDLEYPQGRIRTMLGDACPALVLTSTALLTRLPEGSHLVIDTPPLTLELLQASDRNPACPIWAGSPAYVIYTSGSTGKPKGVVVEHGAFTEFLHSISFHLPFKPGDRHLAITTIGFDISTLELFLPLCHGAEVVLAAKDTVRDPAQLAALIRSSSATSLQATPSHWRMLLEADRTCAQGLRVLVGGEALSRDLGQMLVQLARSVHNEYGPTEATVWATIYKLNQSDADGPAVIPIGTPFANYCAYVLDPWLEPVPAGIAGELYLSGAGLARGYLNRPALTAERFIADPIAGLANTGARMYRTGDLARWRKDGTLEFLGRADLQVKIRGFRIEPGEIEAVLKTHDRVEDAAVVVRKNNGDENLTGYVIARRSAQSQESQLSYWQEVWDSAYVPNSQWSGDFNIEGWNSSYTGQPIPPQEMRAWVDETVASIRALRPRRVLDAGCGTGLLLTRIAPECESYIGLDVSARALEDLGAYIKTRADLHHVKLQQGQAHELGFLADDSIDLVIVNSVAQYFPSLDYLLEVLSEAARVIAPGGYVFLGDLRSLPLLEAYHASVHLHRAAGEMPLTELRERIARAVRDEEELLIDPALFNHFRDPRQKIGHAETVPKSTTYDNELSRFRYDVKLAIGPRQHLQEPADWIEWDKNGTWIAELEKGLKYNSGTSLGVRSIRHKYAAPFVEAALRLSELNEETSAWHVDDLTAVCADAVGEDSATVIQMARRLGATPLWRTGGTEVNFNPLWRETEDTELRAIDFRRYANTPSLRSTHAELSRILREHMRQSLPEYMTPSAILVLPEWPLTPNGKLDRRALPSPDRQAKISRAPRTPIEQSLCNLFSSVLNEEHIGIDDDFFALGGHSLLAARLVSRARTTLGVEFTIRTLFEAPTVAQLVGHVRTAGPSRSPLVRQSRTERLPLSYAQNRLWFLDQLEERSSTYNLPAAVRLRGELNIEALEMALNDVLERHEALRTIFPDDGGVPYQLVLPPAAAHLDLQTERLSEAALPASMARAASTTLDISREIPIRAWLFQLAARSHVLLLLVHHIAGDAWSFAPITRDLMTAYAARIRSERPAFSNLSVQYPDYAVWQRIMLGEESDAGSLMSSQLTFWREALAGAPAELKLPAVRRRPAKPSYQGAQVSLTISPQVHARLLALARSESASLFMVLQAGFAALLCKLGAGDDICIGTAVAGRSDMTLDDLAGFFVNTLVLRTDLSGDPTFRELVQRVRKFDQDAYSHQDVPFERVVQAVRPERSLSRQPLFQVMLLLQNVPAAELVLAGLAAKPEPFQWESAKFDLTLSLQERHGSEREPAGLNGFLEYASDLFNRQMAEDIAARFVRLLETISSHPHLELHDLSLLSSSERGILTALSAVSGPDTVAVPAPTQFEAIAALHPGATAATFAGESLSYAELNARANRLAHFLIRQGVRPGAIVGISPPRSFDMLVALLATLKAGAAYLPLDPSYPQARLQAMIADAQPALVLDSQLIDTSLYPDHNPAVLITPDHLAYVLYTSGSTGTPKGVLIRHAELARYLAWAGALYESSEGCGAPVNTPLAFDATITSLWLPLLSGKTVFLLPDREFIPALGDLLTSGQDFTLVKLTPAHLTALADYLGDRATEVHCRRFVVGGEALKATVANFWSHHVPGLRIVNEYGPTETVVGCCVHIMEPGEQVSGDVPIGFATQGTRLYVLDRWLEPVPLGVWGELYIGGAQVGVGYLNRKALTAERFIADRWTGSGARMYRTGDWVRRRQDGTLEFEGRTDQQVKIRGFRIELGEIEAALTAQPGISQAVAVARDGGQQQARLVAYVIPAAGTQIDTTSLRKALAERLPDYMVPAAFVAIEHFPLSANGKIDRIALPEPERSSHNYRPPRTPAEAVVCRVMREVFDIDQVGADDNFFELGGHSLSATRVASRLNEAFKVVLPIRVIFEYPKFSDLGAEIERLSTAISPESDEADEVIDLWI